MTTRQFSQARPSPSRANGIAAGLLNGAVAKNGARPRVLRRADPSAGCKPETVAAQGGGTVDPATSVIVPPIHTATTFVGDADNQYRRGYCYGRSDNATVRQVERVLTGLVADIEQSLSVR